VYAGGQVPSEWAEGVLRRVLWCTGGPRDGGGQGPGALAGAGSVVLHGTPPGWGRPRARSFTEGVLRRVLSCTGRPRDGGGQGPGALAGAARGQELLVRNMANIHI
jgi:hypothetical protein